MGREAGAPRGRVATLSNPLPYGAFAVSRETPRESCTNGEQERYEMETNQVSWPVSAIIRHGRRGAIAHLVAVLSVGLLVGASRGMAPRPEGIHVEFSQLNWMGLNKAVRFPASRVGEVEFSFDSAAAGLLVGDGVFANI